MFKVAATRARFSLLIVLLAILILPQTAQAYLMCRSDPVVILSNGMILDLDADISTLPTQVKEVHYELHLPEGVSVVAVIRTRAWLTSQETFTVFSDQNPQQYQTVTTVHTTVGNASVSAVATLVSALNIKLGFYRVLGQEGDALTLSFNN
jgi:hypothetical protein